jgi:tRNA A37 threonylcarbamoyladenosine modification protein TsaB
MCQALGATLVGVDGTVAYRAQAAAEPRVCVVIPSRRDLLYTRWFTESRAKGPTAIVLEHELIEALRDEQREWVLVGSGAGRVIGRMGDHPMVRLGPPQSLGPSPLKLARIAADEAGGNLYEIEPLYVESGLR